MDVGGSDRRTITKIYNPCGVVLITQGVDACKKLGVRQDSGLLHWEHAGTCKLEMLSTHSVLV
jgi:hypothetical protein